MSKNLAQIYAANPVTTINATDVMYIVTTDTTDAAISGASIKALFASSALPSGDFFVGNASNVATGVAMSGDAALANTGAVTVSKIGGMAISLAGAFSTVGAFPVIQTYTGSTNVTFPTSGTLATTAGTVANATNIGITDDTTTNASMLPVWVTTNTGFLPAKVSSTKITFNPSTATLTTTNFAGTATNATNVGTTQVSNNASYFPLMVSSSTNGNQAADLGTGLTFNPSTNALTTTTFNGALAGNAATATTILSIGATKLYGNSTGAPANGQDITLGTNLSFTGSTLNVTGNTFTWNDVSGTTQAAAVNNGYIISNASQTTVTVPATAVEGSVIGVAGKGAAGWILQMNTGQTCHFGSSATSSAGSLTSTNQWDSVQILCVTANTTFIVLSSIGNLTVA